MVNLQRRASLFMALAVLLAGIASVLTYYWLQSRETELRDEIQGTARSQSVVVANEDIQAGTAISAESVRLVSFPREAVPDGVFDEMSRVSGRIAVSPFRRNEPILETKLAPVEVTRGGIATRTGRDKRAMAVHVDEVVAVAGFIHPGDHVDVLATLQTDDDKSRPVTKMILENVPVLATGGNATDTSTNAPGGNAEGPHVMTLEVSPREAEKLALAASEGRLHLVLRHPLNGETIDTDGATVEGLLGRGGQRIVPVSAGVDAPPVARASAPQQQGTRQPIVRVEMIRGQQRSDVQFADTPTTGAGP